MSLCGKKGGEKRKKKISGMREKVRKKLKKNQKKGFKKCKRINLTIKRGWQDSQVWGWGGGGSWGGWIQRKGALEHQTRDPVTPQQGVRQREQEDWTQKVSE
jgi:hypothetical protein